MSRRACGRWTITLSLLSVCCGTALLLSTAVRGHGNEANSDQKARLVSLVHTRIWSHRDDPSHDRSNMSVTFEIPFEVVPGSSHVAGVTSASIIDSRGRQLVSEKRRLFAPIFYARRFGANTLSENSLRVAVGVEAPDAHADALADIEFVFSVCRLTQTSSVVVPEWCGEVGEMDAKVGDDVAFLVKTTVDDIGDLRILVRPRMTEYAVDEIILTKPGGEGVVSPVAFSVGGAASDYAYLPDEVKDATLSFNFCTGVPVRGFSYRAKDLPLP